MSVKLPLIIKRQIKPSPRKKSLPQEQQEELNKSKSDEVDYEDDQFEQQPEEEPQKPVQTITILKKEEIPTNQLQVQLIKQKEEPPQMTQSNHENKIEQLQRLLQQKMQLASSLKQAVSDGKKEIKSIGQQIDKDLNKTLLKTTKQNTVNIRDIFSAPPKTNNKRLNDLNQELKNVRIVIKKTKQEIQKLSEGFMDPVILLNQQKGIEFQNQIRGADEDIKHIEKQKLLLSEQIARGGKQFSEEEQKQKNDEISKLNTTLVEILTLQKECKANIYLIQKEDITLMEKIKFFQEREGGLGHSKKSRPSEKQRLKLDEQIRQLIEQVNETIDERNKIQGQKKSSLKNLAHQITSIEEKNWKLCNQLRQIDSYLLQYYEKKSKKKEMKNVSDRIEIDSDVGVPKSVSGKIQSESIYIETPIKTIQYENDKNKKSVDVVLVQKKKNYDFSSKENLENQLIISDQFLGNKLNIAKLVITVDQDRIYRIKTTYELNSMNNIQGFLMGSKTVPQNTKKIEIAFDRQFGQMINFLHVGYHENNYISYLHIVTTEGKEYKWGNAEKSAKNDQKHIKKYEFCHLKAKLSPVQTLNNENVQLCLSGIIFSTIYLGAK